MNFINFFALVLTLGVKWFIDIVRGFVFIFTSASIVWKSFFFFHLIFFSFKLHIIHYTFMYTILILTYRDHIFYEYTHLRVRTWVWPANAEAHNLLLHKTCVHIVMGFGMIAWRSFSQQFIKYIILRYGKNTTFF